MRWPTTALTCAFVLALLPAGARSEDNPGAADEQLLREAGIATDGPGLLNYLRRHTLTSASRARALALIRQLGDRSFRIREKASAELVELGPLAAPLLRQARNDADLEAARRAEQCLREIDKGRAATLAAAAARLVGLLRPVGATKVLLDYYPSVPDENSGMEVERALSAVAVRDGKADPILVGALEDPLAIKRSVAAEALCQAGATGQFPAVRELLKDREPGVRLRVAVALVHAGEAAAVPVLIDLLADLPREEVWRAEQVLCQLAEERPTPGQAGNDETARRQYRAAWAAWWRQHEGQINLSVLQRTPRFLGYTLIVLLDGGRVIELGGDRKPRLEIGGLLSPLDAQVLPGDKVVIAEYGRGVTERNRQGEIVWQKNAVHPIAAQRLPNGHTFIASHSQLLEVDKAGKELLSISRPDGTFVTARKLLDGRIGCVSAGKFILLDAAGRELKSFPVGGVTTTSALDVLPNGNVLVAQYGPGKVVEFDSDGKHVWEAAVPSPISVVRLPNGHTLVASHRGQKQVIELDRRGNTVWDYQVAGHATRARQR